MSEFKLMQQVQWTSQAGGSTKTKKGIVVEIVQPQRQPNRNQFRDLYKGFGVGGGRNHVSYVVRVGEKHYWPRANALQPVVKAECPELLKLRASVASLVEKWRGIANYEAYPMNYRNAMARSADELEAAFRAENGEKSNKQNLQ
jgi:hypothetical protein